ncbi:thioredoxin domain-containing protein [Chloroflexota bacterium]
MNSKYHNQLASEPSPYLLQHADNPVNWFPWGEEAFARARKENKPIFLSIGYSTCHWCHVMAHESFENAEVAGLMNETFVSVKVDREERPDIDMIYMTVCQMMTGSGGWPLTIIMTPDKEPFFATTYIPRETRFGNIGLLELIPRIQQLWSTRQSEVLNSASQIKTALQQTTSNTPGKELGEAELSNAYQQLEQRFDDQHGGFGSAPKFPTPHNIFFLLRYWKRTGSAKALDMVEKTLQAMRHGGIYDHVGFGFHRYSTNSHWLVPHFEKMLYDQALLATAYTEAYQATGKEEYGRTANEIFNYVLRDMQFPEGGFYSAEDADSEGEEGKFYVWTLSEIREVLSDAEVDLTAKVFNILESGNFTSEVGGRANGANILHLSKSVTELAADLNMPEEDLRKGTEAIREKLFTCRKKRVPPQKDDKILTDWNGLMIAALAKGGRVLNEPRYADAARHAADFIVTNLRTPEGRLLHRYRNGQAAVPANLDDYAFMVYALLELYETTFEVDYLRLALDFNQVLMGHFWDEDDDGFYFTADDAENLLVRRKEIYDGAIPSGNSVAMLNLLRLGRITADAELEQRAVRIGAAFSETVRQLPVAHTQLLVALDFAVGPSYEVVIVGNSNLNDTKEMVSAIHQHFIPNKVIILRPTEEAAPRIDNIASFVRHNSASNDKATAYVCLNYKCKLPTTDINIMLGLLDSG